jgi:serine/threonine protein phosphatase 1
MKTFIIGDIHGAYKALKQCLERSGFDYNNDMLIQLGDIADGFDQVYECVEELLKIKNLIPIKGNHDDWLNEFIQTGYHPDRWRQGGFATARSYLRVIGKEDLIMNSGDGYKTALNPADIPESHQQLFRGQHLYYIDDGNNCFVHGGFNRHLEFKGQRPDNYYWDRDLWSAALSYQAFNRHDDQKGEFQMVTKFRDIFIGHTSTVNWKTDQPMKAADIYNLDTGGGHGGRLTIMDLSSKQFWQSDPVNKLYS